MNGMDWSSSKECAVVFPDLKWSLRTKITNVNFGCWLLAPIEDADGILDVMFEEIFVHGNNEKFKTALLLIGISCNHRVPCCLHCPALYSSSLCPLVRQLCTLNKSLMHTISPRQWGIIKPHGTYLYHLKIWWLQQKSCWINISNFFFLDVQSNRKLFKPTSMCKINI